MGTTERRQREAQQRRQDILKAAQKVFWEKGFSGTTMPQVAAEAELAPGTLYLYFPSKDALYVELLVEGYDVLKERLQSQLQSTVAAPERAAASRALHARVGIPFQVLVEGRSPRGDQAASYRQ